FPYICSTAGKKFVSWYDRRNSTAASPDLTAYYRSTVFDDGSATAVGIGTEVNVSGVDDPQCSSGFPVTVSSAIEESGCTNLPALRAGIVPGGTCQAPCAPGVAGPCGSGQGCDFRAGAPACPSVPVAETCTAGSGQPKYGDYNGAACALGTHFVAWASSTPPKAAACTGLRLARARAGVRGCVAVRFGHLRGGDLCSAGGGVPRQRRRVRPGPAGLLQRRPQRPLPGRRVHAGHHDVHVVLLRRSRMQRRAGQ